MAGKHNGLGRGLDALIKDGSSAKNKAVTKKMPALAAPDATGVLEVPVAKVVPSPWQPRNTFHAEALSELVESVKVHGVLQPLLVRKVADSYELIAGERRLRASQEAKLQCVPVIVVEATDEKALEIALIENLQREDLNPIEEAEGYALLQKKFGLTQARVAERVGKARTSVANALRLLELSDGLRKYVTEGLLSVGHAKVLLSLENEDDREAFAQKIMTDGLSVRALEKLVKKMSLPAKKPRAEKPDLLSVNVQNLTSKLHQLLGTSVRISPSKTLSDGRKVKGSLEIDYNDNEELDRLLSIMGYTSER